VHKYRKGKMQRTLKRESKELETVEGEAIANPALGVGLNNNPLWPVEGWISVGSPSKGTRSEGAKILGDTRGGLRASFGPWGPGCSALCCVEAYLWPDVRGGRQVGIGWLGSRIAPLFCCLPSASSNGGGPSRRLGSLGSRPSRPREVNETQSQAAPLRGSVATGVLDQYPSCPFEGERGAAPLSAGGAGG